MSAVHGKHSKRVLSGFTTITMRRQTQGTARKSHTTITRHQEDKKARQPALSSPSDDCKTRMDTK